MIVDTIQNLVANSILSILLLGIPAVILLYHVVPWLLDPNDIRKYPGPFMAKFTDLWLAYTSSQGCRSEIIHDYHLKYGG